MERVVLLFFHGGTYTKECWNPIIKRLEQSPLLQRVPCETVAIDWRFHGERSDDSVPATVWYVDGDKAKPRVDHPLASWAEWCPDDVHGVVKKLRANDTDGATTTKIVAIGHSMGATALLQVEMEHPGTFQGIIAFEPVHGKPGEEAESLADMRVAFTLRRREEWNTWEEVVKHFKTGKMYRRWDADCMDAYLEHGVRKRSDGKYVLATTLAQEAAIYGHAKSEIDFSRVHCPVVIEHAAKSQFFDVKSVQQFAKQFPHKFTLGEPIAKTSHLMVLEDPATCAAHIVKDLEQLTFFQQRAKL